MEKELEIAYRMQQSLLPEVFPETRGCDIAATSIPALEVGGDIYDFSDSSVLGQLAVVGAAACYGAGAVYARSLLKQTGPLELSGGQLVLGAVLALPIMLAVRGTPDYSLSVEAWLSLLTLGVLGTGIAIVAYLWLVDNVGSVRSSLVTYIIPIVGLFLGWAVLDESIGVNTVLGCALIIAGVAAVMRGQAPSSRRLPATADVTATDWGRQK